MSQNDMRDKGRAALATTAIPPDARRDRGLRPTAFSAVVMLIFEYGLGMWVNLYAQIPASDSGKGIFAAFSAAVAHGPLALTLHALLGTLLLVTAIAFVIRAVLARKAAATVIGAISFLAVIAAWLSGARFVGASANAASADKGRCREPVRHRWERAEAARGRTSEWDPDITRPLRRSRDVQAVPHA